MDLKSTTAIERVRFKSKGERRKGKDRRKEGYERRAQKFDKDKADENFGYGPLSSKEYGEK